MSREGERPDITLPNVSLVLEEGSTSARLAHLIAYDSDRLPRHLTKPFVSAVQHTWKLLACDLLNEVLAKVDSQHQTVQVDEIYTVLFEIVDSGNRLPYYAPRVSQIKRTYKVIGTFGRQIYHVTYDIGIIPIKE